MMPVVRGEEETRFQIVLYTVLLVAVTILPFAGQLFGAVYFVSALVLGGAFTWLAIVLLRRRDRRSALRVYLSSLAYLALLFAAMVVDVHV
jgi:protoheme IX farnesyltransferase